MYQQNQSQQSYPQQPYQQHLPLAEQDTANLVLSELKRMAREYATASLEANQPQIRQMFQDLLQKTLQDQADLYSVLSQMNGYGELKTASQQDIREELRKHIQTAQKLQVLVQKTQRSVNTHMEQQHQSSTSPQPFQPTPVINSSIYPNATMHPSQNPYQNRLPYTYPSQQNQNPNQVSGQARYSPSSLSYLMSGHDYSANTNIDLTGANYSAVDYAESQMAKHSSSSLIGEAAAPAEKRQNSSIQSAGEQANPKYANENDYAGNALHASKYLL